MFFIVPTHVPREPTTNCFLMHPNSCPWTTSRPQHSVCCGAGHQTAVSLSWLLCLRYACAPLPPFHPNPESRIKHGSSARPAPTVLVLFRTKPALSDNAILFETACTQFRCKEMKRKETYERMWSASETRMSGNADVEKDVTQTSICSHPPVHRDSCCG